MKIGIMKKLRRVFEKKDLSKLDRLMKENTESHKELMRLSAEYLKLKTKKLEHEKQ